MKNKKEKHMTDKEKPREHKVGPGTGYETDGANYWLAPALINAWGLIQDQERALDAIIEATVRTVAQARCHVEAERRRWWDRVYADLELDNTITYGFNRIDGRVAPVEKEKVK